MTSAFWFIIGLGFGSFASVIIHRLHTHDDGILWGRSKCPRCLHQLNAIDLIPLLGYVINKFKCRYCKAPISMRYPVLELAMGTLFALTAWLTGAENTPLLIWHLALAFSFVTLSFYDIFFQEIPDEVSLPTIVLAGGIGYFAELIPPQSLLIGFLVPVLFFGSMFIFSKGKWIGGGDIRLGAIMGFVLGWPLVLIALFVGYLTGSIFSVGGLATGKFNRKSPIPFGPFLLLGTWITMFWGAQIMEWYLSFL